MNPQNINDDKKILKLTFLFDLELITEDLFMLFLVGLENN